MKKSFTLAETLTTLTILGIIAAVVVPHINKAKPDADVINYKKALYTMQSVVGNATEVLLNQGANTLEVWGDDAIVDATFPGSTARGFCARIADQLNTSKVDCRTNGSYNNPQIITTDGISFWNLPQGSIDNATHTQTRTICMERPFTGNEKNGLNKVRRYGGINNTLHNSNGDCNAGTNPPIGLRIQIRQDGKVSTVEDSYESELVEKSFQIQQKRGK